MKSEVYERKTDARDELIAPILDVAARKKETWRSTQTTQRAIFAHEVQSATEVKGGIFERLSCTV